VRLFARALVGHVTPMLQGGSQFPLAGIAADLHAGGHLPGAKWRAVGACNTCVAQCCAQTH